LTISHTNLCLEASSRFPYFEPRIPASHLVHTGLRINTLSLQRDHQISRLPACSTIRRGIRWIEPLTHPWIRERASRSAKPSKRTSFPHFDRCCVLSADRNQPSVVAAATAAGILVGPERRTRRDQALQRPSALQVVTALRPVCPGIPARFYETSCVRCTRSAVELLDREEAKESRCNGLASQTWTPRTTST